jgi:hypothetical protein
MRKLTQCSFRREEKFDHASSCPTDSEQPTTTTINPVPSLDTSFQRRSILLTFTQAGAPIGVGYS